MDKKQRDGQKQLLQTMIQAMLEKRQHTKVKKNICW